MGWSQVYFSIVWYTKKKKSFVVVGGRGPAVTLELPINFRIFTVSACITYRLCIFFLKLEGGGATKVDRGNSECANAWSNV